MARVWGQLVKTFFDSEPIGRRLPSVLRYGGVRELWIQAELGLWLESLDRGSNSPVDGIEWDTNVRVKQASRDFAAWSPRGPISRTAQLECLAEIKVLGGKYQPKVLTGSPEGIRRVLAKRDGLMGRRDRSTGWGLLGDFHRLADVRGVAQKILVLVIDNRDGGANTELGRALEHIHFSKEMWQSDIREGVRARIWRVP